MTEANNSSSANRKNDHVRLATAQAEEPKQPSDFDSVRFVHHALRSVNVAEVDLESRVAGLTFPVPLFINAMTGGSEFTAEINQKLARVAHETGLPIAAGSMSAVIKNAGVAKSYSVLRELNPDGIVFANLSANATPEQAAAVVTLINADALQLHVNSVQELVMPEGDRIFSHWPQQIASVIEAATVPVIVKEVGFGISAETAQLLMQLGVAAVDVSGRGGTNFARIENARRPGQDFHEFSAWGQSTVASLLDVHPVLGAHHELSVLASGGIRSPLDAVKCLALGARAAGVAGRFLHILQEYDEATLINEILRWIDQMTSVFALLGAKTVDELQTTDVVLGGLPREYCEARGVDITAYARRSTRYITDTGAGHGR